MQIIKPGSWSFKQRFSLRAGTMLLIFVAALFLIAYWPGVLNKLVAAVPGSGNLLWRLGVNVDRYLLAAAAFSLGFLGYSLQQKNPQIQFLAELLLSGVFYWLR